MKFLITGKNGMLAQEILKNNFFRNNTSYSHEELDISNYNNLKEKIIHDKPDIIVNCAAYTNVTKAENDTRNTLKTNFQAVGHLAKICKELDIFLVHFSTDYIFRGNTGCSFKEESDKFPINEYGLSKLAGENQILCFMKNFLIIRVSWLFGSSGHNFVSTISKLIHEKDSLKIVSDQFGKVTYTKDVVDALKLLLKKKEIGIFHFANSGVCSRYQFTKEIYKILKEKDENLDCEISPINGDDWPDPTPRPKYSVLNTEKFENLYKSNIRHWKEALREFLS